MPIFGPNIKKMKNRGDIEGIIKYLKSTNLQLRTEAIEALIEIGELRAIETLVNELLTQLRIGSDEDKIEAITFIQGRAPMMFLIPALASEERISALEKVYLQKKLNFEITRQVLFEIATNTLNKLPICWYALIALIELGDRSDEVVDLLVEYAEKLMEWSKESGIGRSGIPGYMLETSIQEETIRALSFLGGNIKVRDVLIDALHTRRFVGCQKVSTPWHYAIYALGAFGDPITSEHLEYWANHGDENNRKRAQVAIELFGKATFSEIQAELKSKFGIE